jgi:hypothetical protein
MYYIMYYIMYGALGGQHSSHKNAVKFVLDLPASQDNQLSGEVPVGAIATGCSALQELNASRNQFDPSAAGGAKTQLKEARPKLSISL